MLLLAAAAVAVTVVAIVLLRLQNIPRDPIDHPTRLEAMRRLVK